jgi:exo-1,4-beta-D-glucosaminidase
VSLAAGEQRSIAITAARHPELEIQNPRLWWPWELGEPNLYTMKLKCESGGVVLDERKVRFGIREVADYVNAEGYRGYKVNGKRILIRGGGWADELLLREDATNLATQIHYTRDMNLNTIRLEGVWGSSQQLYDLADENGLLVMVGWSCQWEWPEHLGKKTDKKFGGFTTETDQTLATNYLHDQVFWLRNHPSIYVWVLGSDMLPPPALETKYDALLAVIDPTRPSLKTCGGATSQASGPSRVKMEGPYDYVTPNYWYLDRTHGGAFGYNTETGPGPQIPTLESLKKMFPGDDLWPVNKVWNFHSARGEFGTIKRYVNAFNQRYGPATSVEDFAARGQAANYEAIRPMYEAFSVNLPKSTGIVQWMLNASWPKLFWQLYDYYLVPGGAYFGVKKGAAPIAAVYNYGDGGIYLVNQIDHEQSDMQMAITVYDLNSYKIFETNLTATCPVFGSKKLFDLRTVVSPTPVFFLELQLSDTTGKNLGGNFYWLSIKQDVLDEDKSEWFVTPNTSFADFTALNQLPKARVKSEVTYTPTAGGVDAEVTLSNPDAHLAFFIEMAIVGATSQETLVPVMWTDNYVSLPPGAKRVYRAHIPSVPDGEKPELRVRGWNLEK